MNSKFFLDIWEAFRGKKTYALCAASLLATWLGVYTGSVTLSSAEQLTVTALMGLTLRHGIANTVATAVKVVPALALAALAVGLLLMASGPGAYAASRLKGDIPPPVAPVASFDPLGAITALVGKVQTFTVNDITAALADANSVVPPDTRHAQCWVALLPVAEAANAKSLLPTAPGLAELAQKGFDIKAGAANGLLPDSVVTACALTVADLKISFVKLAALVGLSVGPVAIGLPALSLPLLP